MRCCTLSSLFSSPRRYPAHPGYLVLPSPFIHPRKKERERGRERKRKSHTTLPYLPDTSVRIPTLPPPYPCVVPKQHPPKTKNTTLALAFLIIITTTTTTTKQRLHDPSTQLTTTSQPGNTLPSSPPLPPPLQTPGLADIIHQTNKQTIR